MNITKNIRRVLSEEQRAAIETGVRADFGFDEVRFETTAGEPIFRLNELQALTARLCPDLAETQIDPPTPDLGATVYVKFIRRDQFTVTRSGHAALGEQMPSGDTINTEAQALGLATYRAFREAMDGYGFNLTRTLLQKYASELAAPVAESEASERARLSARLHLLARELGYIVATKTADGERFDRARYEQLLNGYAGVITSEKMTLCQLRNLVGLLQADKNAQRTARQAMAA